MVDSNQPPANLPTAASTCAICGARLSPDAPECWLCQAPVSPTLTSGQANRTPSATTLADSPADVEGGLSTSSLVMFVTLAVVVVGVFTIAPGIAIPLSIIAFIAWGRTASKTNWYAPADAKPPSHVVVLTFIRSVLMLIFVICLVAVAAFALFFAMCLVAFSNASNPVALEFFAGAALIIAVAVVALIFFFLR